MAKPTFADFSTTPADNTDINGIGTQGTNAVQNFDNAFRELMAILRRDVPGLTLANSYTKIQKWAKGADVASATSLTLGDDGNYFDITGTTAITSIATKGVGTVVKLHFDAGLTLTHHATDLILPGGANIVTAAGDEAEFIEYATADWRCVNYSRASENWVDVASATTTDIGAVASQNVRITGTTTITGLGTVAAGTFRRVRFAGALTLTYNGTSLILPRAANIVTAAGDIAEFISEGSGNWRCTDCPVSWLVAAQSDMEAASSEILLVTPGREHFHPAMPKAVFNINGGVSPTVSTLFSSVGTISVSRNSTGDYTISWTTAISSLCPVFNLQSNVNTAPRIVAVRNDGYSSTSIRIIMQDLSGSSVDVSRIFFTLFGDLA